MSLLLEKLNSRDSYMIYPFHDLTYTSNEKLMEDILVKNQKNLYTAEGIFVIYTQAGNWLKFGKKLLEDFDKYEGFTPSSRVEDWKANRNVSHSNHDQMIQNYPNPFNPSTQIDYNIPFESKVSIRIFDVLGKETAVLVDNEFKTTGRHFIQWNGRDVNGSLAASGIYFCQIISNSQIQTVRLTLIR